MSQTAPAPRLHPAVRGFDRAAEAYERARPGYPAPAVRYLARALRLGRGRTVVELASGTGKFTRALRPTGAAIVAVEPTAGMRRVFARATPEVAVVAGTAEAIPFPNGFADAVVVAQAFHWFRPGAAVAEIARVLRPGGGLGILWNTRDESTGLSYGISRILARYRGRTPGNPGGEGSRGPGAGGRWRRAFERPASGFSRLSYRAFSHAQRLDRRGVVERVLSVSFVAALPASERRRVAEEVRALLDGVPPDRADGTFAIPYRTDVYWAHRR